MTTDPDQPADVVYPESDGAPLGENTVQVKWIIKLYNGFLGVFRGRDDVFVAANHFWYPVRGEPTVVQAPDLMIAFGRPPHDRGCYKQWEEAGVPSQVTVEMVSRSSTVADRRAKLRFYETFGVEEYYECDPETNALRVWLREGRRLTPVSDPNGWRSPRTGVRFELPANGPLRLIGPNGRPFRTYLELLADTEAETRRAKAAARRADRFTKEADALAAKLRELGIDPDAVAGP